VTVASRPAEISIASRVEAPPEAVWDRVTTPEGINDEMRPWMRMTVPRGFEKLDPAEITLGEKIGRSWILLFGFLPIDYDDLTLVRLEIGRGFLERSRMLSQRSWEHERTLEPAGSDGCLVTDRVRWEPRLGLPGAPLRPLFRWFFRHRHRRLRRRFGGVEV
jgi:ligand-binding SRPBCC domain-containing protein